MGWHRIHGKAVQGNLLDQGIRIGLGFKYGHVSAPKCAGKAKTARWDNAHGITLTRFGMDHINVGKPQDHSFRQCCRSARVGL